MGGKKQDHGAYQQERILLQGNLYQRGYALYYVWQSIGAPKASQKSTFTDYKDWVFYADAVAWAESKGIIKDNGDHKFRPDDAVTRVELAKFIYYAYK